MSSLNCAIFVEQACRGKFKSFPGVCGAEHIGTFVVTKGRVMDLRSFLILTFVWVAFVGADVWAANDLICYGKNGKYAATTINPDLNRTIVTVYDDEGQIASSEIVGVAFDIKWSGDGNSLLVDVGTGKEEENVVFLFDPHLELITEFSVGGYRSVISGDGHFYFSHPASIYADLNVYSFPAGEVVACFDKLESSKGVRFFYTGNGDWIVFQRFEFKWSASLISLPSLEVKWTTNSIYWVVPFFCGGQLKFYDSERIYFVDGSRDFEKGPMVRVLDRASGREVGLINTGRGSSAIVYTDESLDYLLILGSMGIIQVYDKKRESMVGKASLDCPLNFPYSVSPGPDNTWVTLSQIAGGEKK
jgi:hypothetical protein